MPHIINAASLAAPDLSAPSGNWDRSGALWVPVKPKGLSFQISSELLRDYIPSFGLSNPLFSLGPATPPAPAPDLPVERREMPVIGYRAWQYVEKFKIGVGRKPKLSSTGVSYTWRPGVNAAKCGDGSKHSAPDQRCTCGLYVIASLKELEKHATMGKNVIVGAVVGWGRVVQHGTEGWRAQYAKIVALLDCKYSEKQLANTQTIAAAYGLEIKTRPQIQALIREYGDPFS